MTRIVLLLVTLALGACLSAGPIQVPEDVAVASVTIHSHDRRFPDRSVIDRSSIESALRILRENDRNWSKIRQVFPTPETSALLTGPDGSVQLQLFFGWEWIAVRSHQDDSQEDVFLDLNRELRLELRQLFGLQTETGA